MKELKISEVIQQLEYLKENHGDVRVMTVIPYEWNYLDFVKNIHSDIYKNEIVAVIE